MRISPVGLLLVFFLAGCLERKEQIVVSPDGTVAIIASFKTKGFEELYLGDAVPDLERGWFVREWREFADNDDEIFRLEAEQTFGPDVALPDSFAAEAEPLSGCHAAVPDGRDVRGSTRRYVRPTPRNATGTL